jgi:prophage regulatory protein
MVRQILRRPEVTKKTGVGRSGIYDGMANQEFCLAIPLSERAVGWFDDEIGIWQEYRSSKAEGFQGNFIGFLNGLLRQSRDDALVIRGILARFAANAAKPNLARRRKAALPETGEQMTEADVSR